MPHLTVNATPALLQDGHFCGQLVRTLANLLEDGRINRLPFVGTASDLDGSDQVNLGRVEVDSTAILEGSIKMSAPFRDGEVESGSDDATIQFSASLRLRIEQGDAGSQGASQYAANAQGAQDSDPVHRGFPVEGGETVNDGARA